MTRTRWTPRRAALIAVTALAALVGSVGTAAAQTDSGALQANAGGYRNTTDTGAFALPLQGMTFQQDSSPLFDVAPTIFGPTDATGAATDPASPLGTRYVREASAPTGWAPLTTLGSYGSASPYLGSASVSSDGTAVATIDEMSTFVAQAANPPLPTTCGTGLKVLLLLDTSGSTSGYIDQYTTAAKTFVSTLAGTPTTLRISSFGSYSYPGADTYDLATSTGQTAANAEIDRVYGPAYEGGMTNWDAAFQDAAKAGVDVIVFVTDGVPTVHQVNGQPYSGFGGFEDVAYGIAAANLAKYPQLDQALAKQRVLGVGVGSGISVENLSAVSGPVAGSDYTVASNPDDLAAVLKSVAGKICEPTPVTPVTPVIAPTASPTSVILPPASVRGTSVLFGTTGCTYRRAVTTRIVARNAATITFVRDGTVVKRVAVHSLSRQVFSLKTMLPSGDYAMHTVLVRVKFAPGATPTAKAMIQRFAQCRMSAVTG